MGDSMITIHQSAHYAAHVHPSAGLIVESRRKTGGVRLAPDHPQYDEYLYAIWECHDVHEADALCRALLN
jgi:hypothetical protein